eukprot:TRINITY_DN1269_c0_g1_i17.p1 TRINITY_DN1269_c0_g1~~TRINITY_DN1269_c0_g1_i17.p1  ORF type:complete len:311 (+),score=24.92 TRINITY_DN1269_c0_g1_i17:485-1417(+)
MSCIFMGMWDLGSSTYLIISFIISYFFPTTPLWKIFMSYGLMIGLSSLCFYQFFWPVWVKPDDGEQPKTDFKQMYRELRMVIKRRLTWSLVLSGSIIGNFDSWFMPSVTQHMRWHGATMEEAANYLYIWSLVLPCLGFPSSMISGFVIDYSNKKTLVFLSILQICLFTGAGTLAVIRDTPLHTQIAMFCLYVVYRMNGLALMNSVLPLVFPKYNVGQMMGLMWSTGGLLSLAIVPQLNLAIAKNVDNFFRIYMGFIAVNVTLYGLSGLLFYLDFKEGGGIIGDEDEEGTNEVKFEPDTTTDINNTDIEGT